MQTDEPRSASPAGRRRCAPRRLASWWGSRGPPASSRLRLIEAPLDKRGHLRGHLGAHDGGGVEMVFEVERHVNGKWRGFAAAKAQHARQQHARPPEKPAVVWEPSNRAVHETILSRAAQPQVRRATGPCAFVEVEQTCAGTFALVAQRSRRRAGVLRGGGVSLAAGREGHRCRSRTYWQRVRAASNLVTRGDPSCERVEVRLRDELHQEVDCETVAPHGAWPSSQRHPKSRSRR